MEKNQLFNEMEKKFKVVDSKSDLRWNVITEKDFKARACQVFEKVAECLSKTFGPYGSTTILEKNSQMHLTKDGWNVLKQIRFDDPIANNILDLLVGICAQVVIKVGDGSTSSMIASDKLIKRIENDEVLSSIRPKEFLNKLEACVEKITEQLLKDSIKITDDNLDRIYDVAMVSTNGDVKVSSIIKDIYDKTKNPSIDIVKGKTPDAYHEIIEGYQIRCTYLDRIYMTNDDGTCEIDNPLILMFNHKIDLENYLETIIKPATVMALEENRRLVVICPYYDQFLLDQIKYEVNMYIKSNNLPPVVYTNLSLLNNHSRVEFNDFAVFTGGNVIKEDVIYTIRENKFDLNEYIGRVGHISIGEKHTVITGFEYRNDTLYKVLIDDANAALKAKIEENIELNVVNTEEFDLKKRVSKLTGVMSTIYVGGNTPLEKLANYDLVEDAVKACESAYKYGINIGCNLAIPTAITKLETEDQVDERFYALIFNAFIDVYKTLLRNKYTSESDNVLIEEIIRTSLDRNQCYDLVSSEYTSDKIINPCYTDIEILKATTSIIGLLMSSNQYISVLIARN